MIFIINGFPSTVLSIGRENCKLSTLGGLLLEAAVLGRSERSAVPRFCDGFVVEVAAVDFAAVDAGFDAF